MSVLDTPLRRFSDRVDASSELGCWTKDKLGEFIIQCSYDDADTQTEMRDLVCDAIDSHIQWLKGMQKTILLWDLEE